jgi:hypothetical protein
MEDVMHDRALRVTSVVFVVALLVHGADHVRRGIDVMTTQVLAGGTLQFALALVAVALVFRRHHAAAAVAAAVGFGSALGFVSAHLLPHWGAFSDAYVGSPVAPGVTAFSWVTALLEIAADVAFGWAGVIALRRPPAPARPRP